MVPRSAGGDAQPRSPWVNVALALTLASAFALNWGYLSEHSAASKLPPLQVRRPLHSLRLLLGSRGWRNRDPGYERNPYCRRDDAVFRASPRRTARHRAVDLVRRRRRRRRRPGAALEARPCGRRSWRLITALSCDGRSSGARLGFFYRRREVAGGGRLQIGDRVLADRSDHARPLEEP